MRDIKVGDHVHFDGPHFMCAIVTEVNDDGTYTAQAHHEGNQRLPRIHEVVHVSSCDGP
jgi:hypothetical protein